MNMKSIFEEITVYLGSRATHEPLETSKYPRLPTAAAPEP